MIMFSDSILGTTVEISAIICGIIGLFFGFYEVKYDGKAKSNLSKNAPERTIEEDRYFFPFFTMMVGITIGIALPLLMPIIISYAIIYYIVVGRKNDNKEKIN